MEYKILNTRPEVMTVDVVTLKSRIDAHHYRPRFLSAAEKILKIKYSQPSALGHETDNIGQPADIRSYCDSGVPILNAKNVRPLYLNNNECPLVEKDIAQKHKKQTLKGNEVLIVRTGAKCGDVAWASFAFSNYLVNSHVIPIRPKGNLESTFLAAYLSSSLGQMLLDREMTGAAQRQVSVASLNSTIVPLPDQKIQDYIGQKVKLAEKCRERARHSKQNANNALEQAWGWVDIGKKMHEIGRIAHDIFCEKLDDRLDAEYYQPKYTFIGEWLNEQECWMLSDILENPVKGVQPKYDSDGIIPALTVTHIDPYEILRNSASGFVTNNWLVSAERAQIEVGEILYTVTGPPLGETAVVEKYHIPSAINSHIAKIKTQKNFPFPYFITGMLNSSLGQIQTTRSAKGIRQKELYPGDLLRFKFPKIEIDLVKKINHWFRKYCLLNHKALVLTENATSDVEALIEGKLDTDAILSGRLKAPTWEDIEKEMEGI